MTVSDRSTRVLLIEDNPGDADLIRLRLVESSTPVDVSCAQRLSDGLDSLAQLRPSVVLLDLNLPDSQEQKPSAKFWPRLRTSRS
jgi:DNA-binding response OmpR family regulator